MSLLLVDITEGEQLNSSVTLPINKTESKDFIVRALRTRDNSNAKDRRNIRHISKSQSAGRSASRLSIVTHCPTWENVECYSLLNASTGFADAAL